MLTESTILSVAGAALGLLLAAFGGRFFVAATSDLLPRTETIGVNGPVLLFTLTVSIAVGIGFGLAPAVKSWNADLHDSLKEGGRGSGSRHHRAQSVLVVVQMALALVLLAGAGLMLRTIRELWNVNPGFDARHVLTFKVGVSRSLTSTPDSTRTTYQQLIDGVRNVRGVEAADFTATVPLSGQGVGPALLD